MKVSVVIPVYNVEPYLRECVDSVLKQTFTDYEIILVDDGSTDNSGRICDAYAEKYAQIRVIHQKNGGLSEARNTGLREAKGEFIYFLDSDDYILQNCLEELIRTAELQKADVVFFDGFVFFTDCEESDDIMRYSRCKEYNTAAGRKVLLELLKNNEYRTAVPLMLFRRLYLIENDLRFKSGILHEDELFTFLVYNADGVVAHCHNEYYGRRVRPSSIMTSSGAYKRFDSMLQIYRELSEMYKKGTVSGDAAQIYMVRIAKSVLGKYNLLSEADKYKLKNEMRQFKRNVMGNKGYGDMKLKIKCSGKIMNVYYRLQNKCLK